MELRKIFGIAIAVIGAIMLFMFWGAYPPMLSGLAFLLIGAKEFL